MGRPRTYKISSGDRFGLGTVITEIRIRDARGASWRAARLQCDCGTVYEARLPDILKGSTQSCGCLQRAAQLKAGNARENLGRLAALARSPEGRARSAALGAATRKHGLASHPLYGTWCQMMARCYNPRSKSYSRYGGRGIEVCARWHNLPHFIEDIERMIGPRPPGKTLDRKDNDGPYADWNVHWATRAEQVRNSQRPAGARQHPLYFTWWRVMQRHRDAVCARWLKFPVFAEDIGSLLGPQPPRGVFRRVNPEGRFEPGNVCWGPPGRPARS